MMAMGAVMLAATATSSNAGELEPQDCHQLPRPCSLPVTLEGHVAVNTEVADSSESQETPRLTRSRSLPVTLEDQVAVDTEVADLSESQEPPRLTRSCSLPVTPEEYEDAGQQADARTLNWVCGMVAEFGPDLPRLAAVCRALGESALPPASLFSRPGESSEPPPASPLDPQ